MIDNDIERLIARDSGFDLGHLESDIHNREAIILGSRRATRRVVTWQAVVMIFAVIGSAAAGSSIAMRGASGAAVSQYLAAENLAPSALLLGVRP